MMMSSPPPERPEQAQDARPVGPAPAPAPRDAAFWAQGGVAPLKVTDMPLGVVGRNVEGRLAVGPLQGFGQMWQKTYAVRLSGVQVEPQEVIRTWKERFSSFWPRGNRFYAPLTGLAPGEVAVLSLTVGGMPLSTGVLVLYADDESFTLMTPQGHVFAGWITFSAYSDADGTTIAQAQVLMRANDPLYELGMRLGGNRKEDRFWDQTLTALASHFGVRQAVACKVSCLDPRLQWREAGNIWQNAAVRTTLYTLAAPTRWVRLRRAPNAR